MTAPAHTEARGVEFEAEGLDEFSVAVREHVDVVGAGALLPGFHHENIVDRRACDGVDALRLEGVGLVHEARKVS